MLYKTKQNNRKKTTKNDEKIILERTTWQIFSSFFLTKEAIWVLLFGQLKRHIISMGFHICCRLYNLSFSLSLWIYMWMCVCLCVNLLDWMLLLLGTHIASRRNGKFNIKNFIQSHPVCVCDVRNRIELHRCATIWISTFFYFECVYHSFCRNWRHFSVTNLLFEWL